MTLIQILHQIKKATTGSDFLSVTEVSPNGVLMKVSVPIVTIIRKTIEIDC